MDANTVQEIANQLGIGVDQILQYLPAYAQAQIMGWVIPIIIGIVIVIISAIILIRSYKKFNEYQNLFWNEDDEEKSKAYHSKSNIYLGFAWVFGFIGGVVLTGLIVAIPCSFGEIVGWSTSPELMLLNKFI